jgi:hypothetical protein
MTWTPVLFLPGTRSNPGRERTNIETVVRLTEHWLGGRPDVFLINNPTPEEQPLVRAMGVRSTIRVFDWSDDFTRVPTDLAAQEAMEAAVDEILQGADLVLAINETLAARARARGIRAAVVPNGTNMEPEPGPPRGRAARKLRARLTPPVLGYAGFVNERRIDLEIIEHLARSLPKCSLLFLGPVFRDFHLRFPRLPNIHFHPAVPYRVLQDHIRVFDVCLVPHLVNAHRLSVYRTPDCHDPGRRLRTMAGARAGCRLARSVLR